MFFSTRKFLSLLPSLAFIIFTSHVSAQEPEKLSEVLLQLRNHIEQGKMTEALELLDKGQVAAALLENENLNLHEEFLWEASMANLDFANELRNREQYVEYARRAKERWKDYINWFHQLSQEDKGRLSSSHDRINKATTHLGNSILRMHAPRDIFTEYAEIPDVGYLSTVSFTIWKQWLYA
ncbi:MAG: hypothetical protein ACE5I1_20665, partial [bacterium]